MESKPNNVLHFPGKKTEIPPATNLAAEVTEPSRSPRKWIAGLAVVLAASFWANRQIPQQPMDLASRSQGRAIASIEERAIESTDRDPAWEQNLARELSPVPRRGLASLRIGRRPSAEENLRFGFLNRSYAVTMKSGKIATVHWPEPEKDRAVYRGDGAEFLQKYRDAFAVAYVEAIPENQQKGEEGTTETYSLLNESRSKVGEARFELDGPGHLLSLSINSVSTTE